MTTYTDENEHKAYSLISSWWFYWLVVILFVIIAVFIMDKNNMKILGGSCILALIIWGIIKMVED